MSVATLVLMLCLLAFVGISLWGLFNQQRSFLILISSVSLLFITVFGALYAWNESHSLSWTFGYSSVSLLALVSFVRQIRLIMAHRRASKNQ